MNQFEAMHQKLKEFYRDQFRQMYRVKPGKVHTFVQELRDGAWVNLARFAVARLNERRASILAHTTMVHLIDDAVASEMDKLREKADGGDPG